MIRGVPSRRAVLAGTVAAVALAAPLGDLADDAAVVIPSIGTSAAVHPDAELIHVCAQHLVNRAAYVAASEPCSDALWDEYTRTSDLIDDATPCTLDGILAKARCAKAEGVLPDGSEEPDLEGTARVWAWDVVNDLLRLFDNGAAASDLLAAPASGEEIHQGDAELVALCEEYISGSRRKRRLWDEADAAGRDLIFSADRSNGPRPETDPHWKKAVDVSAIPARTQAGIKAKARLLRHWLEASGYSAPPRWDHDAEMATAWSLTNDVLRRA